MYCRDSDYYCIGSDLLISHCANSLYSLERGDSYGYNYPPCEEPETYSRSQLTSYEEAYSAAQEALRSSPPPTSMKRRYHPRNYDSEGYAPDSTDSTEVGMSVYQVWLIFSVKCINNYYCRNQPSFHVLCSITKINVEKLVKYLMV